VVDDVHMLGQDGRAGTGWVAGIAGLLAVVLLTAVGVAALRTDTASADTVLARGADAVLELADGTSRPAVEGERVPRGGTVRAGRTGAVLETRDREVHLGGNTAVTVVDGVRQVLRAGFVLVDATGAPGVELQTDAGTVTSADDSLVRVDGGPLVRVGVLRGDAAAVRAVDRQATSEVPIYFQVQVPTGGLPGGATPFVLTPGDEYERELAADLVAADDALDALASRLDAGGTAGRVVLAALRTEVPAGGTSAAGASGNERALGFLIAAAAPASDDLTARYDRVRSLRSGGGSWGIVAAIVEAEVGRVGAALNALLEPGMVPVVAGQPLDLGVVLDPEAAGAPAAEPPAAPADTDSSSTGAPQQPPPPPSEGDGDGDGDGGGGSGEPSPAPSPTPGPTDPVTDIVDEVVETVMDLISPSPSALPVTVPLPGPLTVTVPLVSPSPLVQVQVPLLR